MISPFAVAATLEKCLESGFDISKVSKCAFQIYQEHGLELAPEMDQVLLMLMAMDEGEDFEISEFELRKVLEDIKSMG